MTTGSPVLDVLLLALDILGIAWLFNDGHTGWGIGAIFFPLISWVYLTMKVIGWVKGDKS